MRRHVIPYGLLGWGEWRSLKSLLVCISFFIWDRRPTTSFEPSWAAWKILKGNELCQNRYRSGKLSFASRYGYSRKAIRELSSYEGDSDLATLLDAYWGSKWHTQRLILSKRLHHWKIVLSSRIFNKFN